VSNTFDDLNSILRPEPREQRRRIDPADGAGDPAAPISSRRISGASRFSDVLQIATRQ